MCARNYIPSKEVRRVYIRSGFSSFQAVHRFCRRRRSCQGLCVRPWCPLCFKKEKLRAKDRVSSHRSNYKLPSSDETRTLTQQQQHARRRVSALLVYRVNTSDEKNVCLEFFIYFRLNLARDKFQYFLFARFSSVSQMTEGDHADHPSPTPEEKDVWPETATKSTCMVVPCTLSYSKYTQLVQFLSIKTFFTTQVMDP